MSAKDESIRYCGLDVTQIENASTLLGLATGGFNWSDPRGCWEAKRRVFEVETFFWRFPITKMHETPPESVRMASQQLTDLFSVHYRAIPADSCEGPREDVGNNRNIELEAIKRSLTSLQ